LIGAARLVLAGARLTYRTEHNQPPVLDIILDLFSYICYASRLNFQPQETAPVSTADPDPTASPARPPYAIPPQDLRDMVLTLPRRRCAGDHLAGGGARWPRQARVLDPRVALQTMLR
jgi:hypothetical protein